MDRQNEFVTKYYKLPYLDKDKYDEILKNSNIKDLSFFDTLMPKDNKSDIFIEIKTISYDNFDKVEINLNGIEINMEEFLNSYKSNEYDRYTPSHGIINILDNIDNNRE